MSKKHRLQRASAAKPATVRTLPGWMWPALAAAAVFACYWTPLTSPDASIQWDAADYFQVVQQYLSEQIRGLRLPFWTPYPWAGYPFLADPQVGAWYPPNWPFFAAGVSPWGMELELALHALLASLGGYYLAKRLVGDRWGALVAGVCYGLSGWFAGHSSHTAMVQAAAWVPWLLLAFQGAVERAGAAWTGLAVMAAGLMILAGHFQTALYGFLALALFAAARLAVERKEWKRTLAVAAVIPVGGTLLSAVETLPGLELAANCTRTQLAAIGRTEGMIPPAAPLTLVYPNYYGVFSEDYRGPEDITQYYFYAGVLLVPLAALGLRHRVARWAGLALVVPTVWYAAGQGAGLYRIIARLPGFSSVRAPVNIWFVPALGLALLAAAGLAWASQRWPSKWLPAVVFVFVAGDLWYWNWASNPLAYARASYEQIYGRGLDLFRRVVAATQPPLSRYDGPDRLTTFGPMSHQLAVKVETTYGYGPLVLAAYNEYIGAMRGNPKLRNGLNVSRYLDTARRVVVDNPEVLPRANFPKALRPVRDQAESRRRLATLDPSREALAPPGVAGLRQDGSAAAEVTEFSGGHYRIRYRAATDSLLRVSAVYFPGWRARTPRGEQPVLRVDHALMGVVVPAGEGEVALDYHSTYFGWGLGISGLSLLACAAVALAGKRRVMGAAGG